MFDGRGQGGFMNTMLKMKIVVPASAGSRASEGGSASRGGSTDPREFLAMRARQKKARLRIRRWKRGLLIVGCAGMAALALASPRWRHRQMAVVQQQLQSVALAAAPAPAAAPVAAPEAAPEVAPVVTPTPAEAPHAPEVVAPAEASTLSGCNDAFSQRQWKTAVATCTLAFEAAPDAALALKVAQAHWSRGEIARAGKWAERAVELGTDDADAFVLIGHAERQAGHTDEALAAYRKYVKAAPHGWHVGRVWAAIRELKAERRPDN
jgi:tetratricopeptide (TPR) repeat protein